MKKLLKRIKENSKGFSLVELIVVIAIMAILVGVLGATFIPYIEKSRESTDITNLQDVESVIIAAMAEEIRDTAATPLSTFLTNVDGAEEGGATPIRDAIVEGIKGNTDLEPECTCEDDLECWVEITSSGIVTVYFTADEDGATAYVGKNGKPLSSTGNNPIGGEEDEDEEPTT